MAQLFEIKEKLSPNQKKNLGAALHKRETIVLRLSKDALTENDTLYVPQNVVRRLQRNKQLNKGMDIKLAKTNIRNQVGGNLLTSILSLGRTFAPQIPKTLGLSALAGLASEGASQVVKKITGRGQTGGFMIPQNQINQLIAYKHLLTEKQEQDIVDALQSGGSVMIKPTNAQSGGFLGSLLGSVGAPIAVDLVGKLIKGKGAPQMGAPPLPKSKGGSAPQIGMYQPPPPFIGSWDKTMGYGAKNKKNIGKGTTIRKKQRIQFNSSDRSNIIKPKFQKNIPMSNHDLLDWCKFLKIPINEVLSRDQSVPHNHEQALFIYNLEPSYMSGSHWVTTYVKDNKINYFDSFDMPPFQELVDHAKRKNLTLLHQNNQIQNLMTSTCGYFCLYFLNEMNKGKSFLDLLKVFDIHDTIKNENVIEKYFENII